MQICHLQCPLGTSNLICPKPKTLTLTPSFFLTVLIYSCHPIFPIFVNRITTLRLGKPRTPTVPWITNLGTPQSLYVPPVCQFSSFYRDSLLHPSFWNTLFQSPPFPVGSTCCQSWPSKVYLWYWNSAAYPVVLHYMKEEVHPPAEHMFWSSCFICSQWLYSMWLWDSFVTMSYLLLCLCCPG